MQINAKITLLFSEEGMMLEVHDADASTQFLKLTLTPEVACQMLARLSHVPCEKAEVFGLEKVGKKMEMETLIIEMPPDTDGRRDTDKAKELANAACPEGWKPDNYFNSQDSFFEKDGKFYARTTIRRWVDK